MATEFFSMKVRGLKKLERKLKKLSNAARGRALAMAADAASEPILKQMDARVSSPGMFGTGELRYRRAGEIRARHRPLKSTGRVRVPLRARSAYSPRAASKASHQSSPPRYGSSSISLSASRESI